MNRNFNAAWYCQGCGRKEQSADNRICPDCGGKMQRCSRYEWFLFDELKHLLYVMGAEYTLTQQYPIKDHRGFNWYFDIYAWIKGNSSFGGYGELIEINGADHSRQAEYSGPGGGYTKDQDKHWEIFSAHKLYKQGINYRVLSNEDCTWKEKAVYYTAIEIVDDLLARADSWC